MSEFKVGDAVRIKGQRGRPRKWYVKLVYEADNSVDLFVAGAADDINTVSLDDVAPYPVKAIKAEEVI